MTWWAGLVGVASPAPSAVERSYSLDYSAPAGCPDAAALAQAIETRTPGARQQPADHAGIQLRVELRDDGTSTLWVQLPDGASRRELPQAACADTVTTVAVIASMLLEAEASERSATALSLLDRVDLPAPPTDLPAPPTEVPRPATTPKQAPNQPQRATRATRAKPAPFGEKKARPAPARLRFGLTAGALLESAVAEGAAIGGSVGLLGWREPARPSVWAPRVQAELLATLPATVNAQQGDVELRLWAARLNVCPMRFAAGRALQLVPCLTGDAGSLRAQGTGSTLNPQTRKMLWLTLGGTARAQLTLSRTLALESWVGLRSLAGGADRFVFRPGILAYQVPQLSLGAGLGVTATLP